MNARGRITRRSFLLVGATAAAALAAPGCVATHDDGMGAAGAFGPTASPGSGLVDRGGVAGHPALARSYDGEVRVHVWSAASGRAAVVLAVPTSAPSDARLSVQTSTRSPMEFSGTGVRSGHADHAIASAFGSHTLFEVKRALEARLDEVA